ncbi:EamA family transporter RarD [Conexibacter sp. SYSU D00693]|uniref:EamA family transporter RarD n=1 Tax=Conexibacter sp. SYSU D00693 TaxID=2812560 RepID=UPI00196B0A53|nr:EamA family transporter RarD [Conexibacter sp. SYSU D00693]
MRSGVLFGIGAYGLWGVFPLYFPLLEPSGSVEVLAHRIGWTLVVVVLVLAARRRVGELVAVARERRVLGLLAAAAVLIAVNWGTYIHAVTSDQTIDAALGYFITPLVSVAFGMVVLGERLRRVQAVAVVLGAVAVVVLTAYHGGFPWIALVLAASFGTYGLLKKLADVGAPEGLAVETLVLVVPALVFLAVLWARGEGTFTTEGTGHALLVAASGPITALPLLLFAACVVRVPLTTVGLLQYLAPVLQFLVGWLLQDEAMPGSRWAGFALVWVALVLLTWDGLRAAGTARRQALEPVAEPA